jgi:hypothetical protein
MLAGELERYRAAEAEKAAKRERARQARQAAERAERDQWAAAHAELAGYLATADRSAWPSFLWDMADTAAREPLTERQTEVATRIMREQIARAQQRAEDEANAADIPSGTVTVTGEVISTRLEDNPYSPRGGCTSRMLVKADDGWRVWVTIPESINDVNKTIPGNLGGLRGARVRFTCEIQPKRGERAFGYGKRPRKAEILTPATV